MVPFHILLHVQIDSGIVWIVRKPSQDPVINNLHMDGNTTQRLFYSGLILWANLHIRIVWKINPQKYFTRPQNSVNKVLSSTISG